MSVILTTEDVQASVKILLEVIDAVVTRDLFSKAMAKHALVSLISSRNPRKTRLMSVQALT